MMSMSLCQIPLPYPLFICLFDFVLCDDKNRLTLSVFLCCYLLCIYTNTQDSYKGDETSGESLSKSLVKGKGQKEPDKFEEAEKNQSNIVTSLAEKAMSVAAPVVPTKEGGEVDQERY